MEKEENPDLLCAKCRHEVWGERVCCGIEFWENVMFVVISSEELDFRTCLSVGFTSELV